MTDILHSIYGRVLGISALGDLVLNGKIAVPYNGVASGSQYTVITSAQLLALNATPITVVTAPGAGLAVVPTRIIVRTEAGTAYAGIAAGEDLVLKYTNGSGTQCSSVIETTGFLDQATAQIRTATAPASSGSTAGDVIPVANAAVVLHLLTGEIITGTSPLYVKVFYNIINTTFTS